MTAEQEKYQRYLCSREWAVLKEAVKARAKGMCERCRRNPLSDVHHVTYARKYHERLEDLQATCRGCHDFTHAKSDVDPAQDRSLVIDGREIASVYLAGKVNDNEDEWRWGIVGDGLHDDRDPFDWATGRIGRWPVLKDVIRLPGFKPLAYTGPFYTDQLVHGGFVKDAPHGFVTSPGCRANLLTLCLRAIEQADLVFAWIDDETCHGTLVEIGYAHAAGKLVVIASQNYLSELWFAYTLGDHLYIFENEPRDVPNSFETAMLAAGRYI